MKHSSTINRTLVIVATLAVLAGSASVIRAYTPPTNTPPNGGVPAPVNVGSVSQVKLGGLGANFLTAANGSMLMGGTAPTSANLVILGNTFAVNDGAIGSTLRIFDGVSGNNPGDVLTLQSDGTAKWDPAGSGNQSAPVTLATLFSADPTEYVRKNGYITGNTPCPFAPAWGNYQGGQCQYINNNNGESIWIADVIYAPNKSVCMLSEHTTEHGGNSDNGDAVRLSTCKVAKDDNGTWYLRLEHSWYPDNIQNLAYNYTQCRMTCY